MCVRECVSIYMYKYKYIYIFNICKYICKLRRNTIVRLPHPQSRDSQARKRF